jgi:prepilin-type N-terminal cleavage/methylation domain-containing protein
MRLHPSNIARQRGFTLLDLLTAVAIVAVLSAAGIWKMNRTGDDTLWYQAQRLARDIRHVQLLSATWGRQLQITATSGANGTYQVSCVTSGAWPCNATPIVDPTTGKPFTVALQHGVSLSPPASAPRFDLQGRPLTTAGAFSGSASTYTLTYNGTSVAVAIAPVTGFVSTTP